MKSTGEVMGISESFSIAFAKSQLAAGTVLPHRGQGLSEHRQPQQGARRRAGPAAGAMGFELLATGGTAERLEAAGIEVQKLMKVQEGHPNLLDY